MFKRTLPNGEISDRKWLMYSIKQGSIYCFMCKLFSSHFDSPFVSKGFDKWKKYDKISQHENSIDHRTAFTKWLSRSKSNNSINKEMLEQISTETKYWNEVVIRVISVIKFLTSRGLSFRGDNEIFGVTNNGNFLGILELISEFDPFLKSHIERHGNKGKGHPSYLSKTICNEIIILLQNNVINFILAEIKEAKYFSIIMDSTPDLSKVDQMAIVIRYCTLNSVYERLLKLSPIKSHQGESIFMVLEEFLKNSEINITNCRGQSYDNASNMSGKYKGLQAYVKNKCNLAVYIPCTAHSLNLVGVHSVDCCIEAVNFFGFLQCLFNLFSGSRWDILTNTLDKNAKGRLLVLKSLSDTRWSCHAESCQALAHNYIQIIKSLKFISENNSENGDSKRDAKLLLKQIFKKETAYLTFFWKDILDRSNKTSLHLQDSSCDPLNALNLLMSLQRYISNLRNTSAVYEKKVIELGPEINSLYHDEERRLRRISTKNVGGCGSNNIILKGSDKFRVETHNIIVDKFCSELDKRIKAYKFISDNFLFVTILCVSIDTTYEYEENDIELSINNFILTYKEDVDDYIKNEIKQFHEYFSLCRQSIKNNEHFSILDLWKWFNENELINVFPNLYIALKIYLTIPSSNCSAERAFSKLKRVKNKYRTTINQENLTALMILASENDVFQTIDNETIIQEFCHTKARKKL